MLELPMDFALHIRLALHSSTQKELLFIRTETELNVLMA